MLGDADFLLDEIAGNQRAGRPDTSAYVQEGYSVQIAGRLMMVDHGVNGGFAIERMPACFGLAVHHDDSFLFVPADLLNGNEVEIEGIDHGPVFSPTNRAVLG